jgi:hypothetical protein
MYQFSRAIYRELAPLLRDSKLSNHANDARRLVLQECESAMQRLFTDRRHFARPTRTLFANVRPFFAISDLSRVFTAIERNIEVAQKFLDQAPELNVGDIPRHCHATTRKGTPCRRQPLPRSEYCPSHQHLTETFEDLQLEQGELGLTEFERMDLAA